MKTFEIGKTYTMWDLHTEHELGTYTVVARTARTVTLDDGEKVQRYQIPRTLSQYFGAETVYPLGQYSAAPSLHAF